MPLPEAPQKWAQDQVSGFFDIARNNEYATFANLTAEVNRLLDIDLSYRKAIEALNHSQDWFAGFFVLRAHSNFLAACRLGWSGQIPECYAVLRSCLENSLYGLYLANNPNSRETWLHRHDTDESKKAVRKEFQITRMLELVKFLDRSEGEVAELLYERTIDQGSHPNERTLTQMLQVNENPNHVEFKMIYVVDDVEQLKLTLKTTAQVGVCALSLFRLIYKERFDILGISAALEDIKVGL